jgi:hypothetical protein
VAGISHAGSAGARLGTAGRLRDLPLVVQAVLDGILTPEQARVLARLVGTIRAGRAAGQPSRADHRRGRA